MSEEPTSPTATDVPETGTKELFPASFGAYTLLHRIARGGMGNVFLAKTAGSVGIEKHCVVKTLRGQFLHDPEYVERFMGEARVVVQLSHRNICPVFDVGRVGQSYFLAMELVLGRDVRTVQNELQARDRRLSQAAALYIACETLDALDYAHRHVDNTTGEPLHLVHRDVSPQNILVSNEGEVKLIDFGLAETGRTAPVDEKQSGGTVMGKMAYMAPEQARGEAVDARADQFAAAVVLYELVAGERYYAGLSANEMWRQAGTGAFRPKHFDDVDEPLRAILARALDGDREKRFATCGDFRDALLAYAQERGVHAGRELRGIMAELFASDVREMRELLQRFAHVASAPRPGFVGARASDGDIFSIATSSHADTIHDPTVVIARSVAAEPAPGARTTRLAVAAAAVLVVVAVALLFVAAPWSTTPATTPPTVAAVPANPPATTPTVPAVPAAAVAATPVVPTVGGEDPEPAAHDRVRKKPAAPAKPATTTVKKKGPDWAVQLDYVKAHCPQAACTQRVVVDVAKAPKAFMDELPECYAACRR